MSFGFLSLLHGTIAAAENVQEYSGAWTHRIAACTGLQSLRCVQSSILSDDAGFNVLTGPENTFHIPDAVSVLTCLTELVNGGSAGPLLPTNIYGLKSLNSLELCSCTADVTLGNGLTGLRHLARLKLTVCHTVEYVSDLRLRLDFNWAALDSLQQLSIQCDEFYCSQNMLDILAIKVLQTVEITNTKPGDTARSFALLVYELAKCRSDVCLKLA